MWKFKINMNRILKIEYIIRQQKYNVDVTFGLRGTFENYWKHFVEKVCAVIYFYFGKNLFVFCFILRNYIENERHHEKCCYYPIIWLYKCVLLFIKRKKESNK